MLISTNHAILNVSKVRFRHTDYFILWVAFPSLYPLGLESAYVIEESEPALLTRPTKSYSIKNHKLVLFHHDNNLEYDDLALNFFLDKFC